MSSFPNSQCIQNVAIIGAGAAGLISAMELSSVGLHVTVFEKQSEIGGVWNTREISPMYSSLRTNLPKEIMAFNGDNPFPEYEYSFLSREEVHRYLQTFATTHQLHDFIKLNTEIIALEKVDSEKWCVTSMSNEAQCVEVFDAVLVCNGHFEVPYYPGYPGYPEHIQIQTYHSTQYEQIKNHLVHKKILIVGTKSSGTDLARELAAVTGNTVVVADRSSHRPHGPSIHCGNIELLPGISQFLPNNRIEFTNGIMVGDIEVIVWCTGYSYSLPFLSLPLQQQLKVRVDRDKQVKGLYQHLFAVEDNTICFLGLPFTIVPFPLFWLQARWIAQTFVGKCVLPSKDEQESWYIHREKAFESSGVSYDKYHFLGGQLQWDYCHAMAYFIDPTDTKVTEYLRVIQEIYEDCTRRKPNYTGAADSYRNMVYKIDRVNNSWSVQEYSEDIENAHKLVSKGQKTT